MRSKYFSLVSVVGGGSNFVMMVFPMKTFSISAPTSCMQVQDQTGNEV